MAYAGQTDNTGLTHGIDWARTSQFNWVFDNCGGTPLQEVVSGLWSGAKLAVSENRIIIPEAMGGGKVYYLRGVWKTEALFAWGGFWVDPESGDTTNYYTGGNFSNSGNETIVTLGTGLADGTEVQAYYIYNTGEKAAKYEALNSVPCMRRAWRSGSDYTYDYAVDRIFDAMAAVYFAYREQGLNPEDILQFFWDNYYPHAQSNGSFLVWEDFNRTGFDKGSYLLYADSTQGTDGFTKFNIEVPGDDATYGRALRFVPAYYEGPSFSAWFGYGFNWDLRQVYFDTISRVMFKLRGTGAVSRVQRFIRTAGTGTADMILVDGFNPAVVRYFVITVTKAGAPGDATATLAVYDSDLNLLNDADPDDGIDGETIICPSSTSPVLLGHGLQGYWLDGTLAVGDTWMITCGNQEIKPHRLQIILNDSIPADDDPFGETHTFVHGIPDYWHEWQEFEIDFSQFWRLGNIIDCRDRRPGRWGNWSVHNGETGTPYEMLFYDVEETNTISGETFYTKQRFSWNLDPDTIDALGFYVGMPSEVDSTGSTNINYLIRHYLATDTTFRTKVRDANGNYFYHDDVVAPNEWVRVSINLSSFLPESGGTLTHPLALVDIGIPSPAPAQGSFDLLDLKFDNHHTFRGADHLRVVEIKHQETGLILTNGPDWYLDDFGFDLEVDDAYPYAPRLAISLNAYGRNPWRGPTLVHYSHPLAPYLVNRFDIKNTEMALHTDAQDEFYHRYGGVTGPILPVHSRNDIENIALCGEENFNRFSWWPRYRDYGKVVAAWRFNETLADSETGRTLTMAGGSATYGSGVCQPGNTALTLPGSTTYAYCAGTDFWLSNEDFVIEAMVNFNTLGTGMTICGHLGTAGNYSWRFHKSTGNYPSFEYSTNGSTMKSVLGTIAISDNDFHHLVVTRNGGTLSIYVDGVLSREFNIGTAILFQSTGNLQVGAHNSTAYLNGGLDYLAIHKGRGMAGSEVAARQQIMRGELNGSDYPEVGHGLGQYWAFYRLGEYYFVSHDGGAWDILDNWLNWFETYLTADGSGWKFPVWFSEYGFAYGDYDPGAAASIAIGALYIYMRNGDARALTLAQRILTDLGSNRASGDYGGYLYKSDYHYAWINALVAHAFGLAVVGRSGAAYRYPYTAADETHYQNMMANFWAMSGDTKPNLLNRDLIPYHDCEPHDIWDYAPYYLFMKEMGSMEGVVLMMHAAIDWALYNGSWYWFNSLLEFMVRLSGVTLGEQQLYAIRTDYVSAQAANVINVPYGDYRRDNTLVQTARDQGLIDLLGEVRQIIPLHYGSPVVTEDANTAAKIAQRALAYFATPKEMVQVVTDLAGARLELHDTVRVQSRFHDYGKEGFVLIKRQFDPGTWRVKLDLMRPACYSPSWAVEEGGGDYDSYAIELGSSQNEAKTVKRYAY